MTKTIKLILDFSNIENQPNEAKYLEVLKEDLTFLDYGVIEIEEIK